MSTLIPRDKPGDTETHLEDHHVPHEDIGNSPANDEAGQEAFMDKLQDGPT